ncbi:MAG: transglutaminase domain-containing protein [Firmicutes bacterium]|nr:transglutaminase domain-containing protein [Bacillota bacterium]
MSLIQGLLLHAYWVGHYGVSLTEEQRQHASARHMEKVLAIILDQGAAPLTVPRAYEKRFFGTCRDFSLFLTSALRHKGIPARCRCGFAKYFWPGQYEDHWIVEYWDAGEGRWVAVDAQLDGLQREKLHISFDPLRLPAGQFVTGAEAWKLWRAGEVDPNKFGIAEVRGFPVIFGNLVRDLAALNKMELLPWDIWGLMKKEQLEEADFILADQIASLINTDSEEMFHLYKRNKELQAPECPMELRLFSGSEGGNAA